MYNIFNELGFWQVYCFLTMSEFRQAKTDIKRD